MFRLQGGFFRICTESPSTPAAGHRPPITPQPEFPMQRSVFPLLHSLSFHCNAQYSNPANNYSHFGTAADVHITSQTQSSSKNVSHAK
eukprot:6431768-Pyramimonas_sp.AAC.1